MSVHLLAESPRVLTLLLASQIKREPRIDQDSPVSAFFHLFSIREERETEPFMTRVRTWKGKIRGPGSWHI